MKQILVMMAAVVLVGCSNETPETLPQKQIEKAVRYSKPTPEPADPVSPADETLTPFLEAIRNHSRTKETHQAIWEKSAELLWRSVGTEITDEVLKKVAKLQNLKRLALTDYKITDAGLEWPNLQKLESIASAPISWHPNHRRGPNCIS